MAVDAQYYDHIKRIEQSLVVMKDAIQGSYNAGWNDALDKAMEELKALGESKDGQIGAAIWDAAGTLEKLSKSAQ